MATPGFTGLTQNLRQNERVASSSLDCAFSGECVLPQSRHRAEGKSVCHALYEAAAIDRPIKRSRGRGAVLAFFC